MKGQVFSMDAFIAFLLFLSASYFSLTAAYGLMSVISEDFVYRRYEQTALYLVSKLSLGDGAWACKIGELRVPGCVRIVSNPGDSFLLNNLNCAIEGDDRLANMIGCNTQCPLDAEILYKKGFSLCITTTTPQECIKRDLTLCLWR